MALAVSATIGVRARPSRASSSRIVRTAVGPSITGICTSIRITSHRPARQASRAWAPSETITGSMPAWCSRVCSTSWLIRLSSAASTRSGGRASCGPAWGAAGADTDPASARAMGRRATKVLPSPSTLTAPIAPPISSQSSRQMARPRPVPP